MFIILSEAEQKLSRFLAKKRYESNRNNGVKDAKVGPQSNWKTDLEGVASEIAFCKLMNVYPDLDLGTYGDADCYSVKMGGTDVKSTKYKNGKLLARRSKEGKEPDSYALMIGEFPKYRFAGWVKSSKLINDRNLTDLGYGKTFALNQNELNKLG